MFGANGHGVHKANANGAYANANVFAGNDVLGGCLGVVVSEGIDNEVGVFVLQLLGDRIYKGEQVACGAALFGTVCYIFFIVDIARVICVIFVRRLAVIALAIFVFIVLRNRSDIHCGVFFKSCTQIFESSLEVFLTFGRIQGEAGVGRKAVTCFGQGTQRVNEQAAAVGLQAAVFCIGGTVVRVNALLGAPICLGSHAVPVEAARFKIGGVFQEDAFLEDDVGCGNGFQVGGEVTNTAKLLKKLVNAVEHAALVAAHNGHACSVPREGSGDHKRIVLKGFVNREGNGECAVLYLDLFHREVFCKLFCGIKLAFG